MNICFLVDPFGLSLGGQSLRNTASKLCLKLISFPIVLIVSFGGLTLKMEIDNFGMVPYKPRLHYAIIHAATGVSAS